MGVDVNAQQFNLSGIVLLCESVGANLVVVEGGMKGVKKFIRLMLHRISWDKVDEDSENNRNGDMTMHGDNSDNEDETQDVDGAIRTTGGDNRCDLLWQGLVAKRSFHAFRFQECRTSMAARKVLEAKGVTHYWDMVIRA